MNGWLKAMPPDASSVQTFILSSLPEEATSLTGRYRLRYEGEGILTVIGGYTEILSQRPGEIWFRFRPGGDGTAISITATDPKGTGNHIRNISILHERNIVLYEAGGIFNPDWIERIKSFRSLRFMDWMFTNGSAVTHWEERPKVGNYTYVDGGPPIEIMVSLANKIGADPWFNMPHMADDTYVRNFAKQVRNTLDPRLRAYVEYSNEMWNWAFPQTHWALSQANQRWGEDAAPNAWLQFYGLRAAEIARIWDSVFMPNAESRLINVIGTHTGWPGLEEGILQAPLYVAEDPTSNSAPVGSFDAYAVTGYFGLELGGNRAKEVLIWIAESKVKAETDAANLPLQAQGAHILTHRYNYATKLAAEALRVGSVSEIVNDFYRYQASVAAANGLDLVMYEGGTHVVAMGEYSENQELTDFFHHFNYSMEMADLYQILLEGWRDVGGTLFNAFVDVSDPSQYGSWGALRHLDDENPRWDVLNNFNDTVAAWWETRDADAFDQGLFLNGTSGADILAGTVEEDILLGGQGNDTLIGYGGEDRLHGGTGQDTAWLIGSRSDYSFEADGDTLIATHSSGRTFLTDVETIIFDETPDTRVSTSGGL